MAEGLDTRGTASVALPPSSTSNMYNVILINLSDVVCLIHTKRKCKTNDLCFCGGYVPENFLAGRSAFLESLLFSWQPHDDNKTPGSPRQERAQQSVGFTLRFLNGLNRYN